jgi:hypothetical protein
MRVALEEFTKAVARVQQIADWLDSQAGNVLATSQLATVNAMQCGCVVLLTGYFESFLKNVIEAAVRDINQLCMPFIALPRRIRHQHFEQGGQVLRALAARERRTSPGTTSTAEGIAGRLASVTAGPPYTILWEAFADTQANPGPDVVRDLLGAFEIDDPWRQMNQYCGGHAERLRTWLETFIPLRNSCAHTGNVANPPGNSELRDYASNMIAIATAIVSLLETRVASL